MWFAVITIFPEYFDLLPKIGITSRAFKNNQVELTTINPRDFTENNYQKVDDKPFGGGAGMVMLAEPLAKSIKYAKNLAIQANKKNVPVVYMSPQGKKLTDSLVDDSLQYDGMIFLCGRYDGIDERIITNYVDFECSIGDYVLSGGEIPALTYLDAIIRKLPNVLGNSDSIVEDSFVNGLLDYPQYSKPVVFEGESVPDILRGGNHKAIKEWRFIQQYQNTKVKRPDLQHDVILTKEQKTLLQKLNIK